MQRETKAEPSYRMILALGMGRPVAFAGPRMGLVLCSHVSSDTSDCEAPRNSQRAMKTRRSALGSLAMVWSRVAITFSAASAIRTEAPKVYCPATPQSFGALLFLLVLC